MDTCSEPGCDQAVKARTLCNKHYQRLRMRGNTDDPVCVEPGCCEPQTSVSAPYCTSHPDNPWRGQQECPLCGSSDWTLPWQPGQPWWRCVACNHGWTLDPVPG